MYDILNIFYNTNNLNNKLKFNTFKNNAENLFKCIQNEDIERFNCKLNNDYFIICLSEKNNINPMWAHYGDNHEGVCIDYDLKNIEIEELSDNNKNNLLNNIIKDYCFPIHYVNNYNFTEDLEALYNKDSDGIC